MKKSLEELDMKLLGNKLFKYCTANLDLNEPDHFNTYFSSVPICVFNSIFSINTKYEVVLNAIDRFCK